MCSSGGGQSTTVQKSDPWKGVQPFLQGNAVKDTNGNVTGYDGTGIYSQAQNLFKNSGWSNQMNSLANQQRSAIRDRTSNQVSGVNSLSDSLLGGQMDATLNPVSGIYGANQISSYPVNTALTDAQGYGATGAGYSGYDAASAGHAGYQAANAIGTGYSAAGADHAGYQASSAAANGYDAATIAGAKNIYSQNVGARQALGSLGAANPTDAISQMLSGQVNSSSLDPVVQNATQRLIDNFQTQVLPGVDQGATAAGQYGSSRQGIAQGLAMKGLSQSIGDMSSNMYNNAYNTAQGLMGTTGNNMANLGFSNAQSNASRDLSAQQTNAANQLAAQQYNANALNSMGQFNATAFNTTSLANAAAQNAANQFGANAFNNAALANSAAQNAASQFGASAANTASLSNANAANTASQFGANAYNNASLANASAQNAASQFGANAANTAANNYAAAQNAANQFGANAANTANQYNANSLNNMGQFNATQNMQAQTQNAANSLNTQQFNANLGLQNNTQALQSSQQQLNNRLQGLNLFSTANALQDNAYSQQQGLLNAKNDYNWNNLNNYSSIVQNGAKLGGTSSSQTPYYSNPLTSALGIGASGLGLYNGMNAAGLLGSTASSAGAYDAATWAALAL